MSSPFGGVVLNSTCLLFDPIGQLRLLFPESQDCERPSQKTLPNKCIKKPNHIVTCSRHRNSCDPVIAIYGTSTAI